jgi:7-cyano-7-deazaguanine synthase
VKMALDLGVPLQLTWSCRGDGERACGHCEACRVRRDAFSQLNMEDPTDNLVNRGI